jgi:hypothetical protein
LREHRGRLLGETPQQRLRVIRGEPGEDLVGAHSTSGWRARPGFSTPCTVCSAPRGSRGCARPRLAARRHRRLADGSRLEPEADAIVEDGAEIAPADLDDDATAPIRLPSCRKRSLATPLAGSISISFQGEAQGRAPKRQRRKASPLVCTGTSTLARELQNRLSGWPPTSTSRSESPPGASGRIATRPEPVGAASVAPPAV